MTPADIKSAVDEVEIALRKAERPTKSIVIRTLSGLGLCSPSSTGTENTLLKAVQKHGIAVPAKFAELMQVPAGKGTRTAAEAETLDSVPENPPVLPANPRTVQRGPGVIPSFSMTGGLSVVAVRGQNGTAFFTDGEQRPIGGFDESDLRLNYNLLEFSVSSN